MVHASRLEAGNSPIWELPRIWGPGIVFDLEHMVCATWYWRFPEMRGLQYLDPK